MDPSEFSALQTALYYVFAPSLGWLLALAVVGSILIAVFWLMLHLARHLTRP